MGAIREVTKKNGEKSYHAEVRLKGHPPERDSFRTKTKAKEWIQETEAAIRDGRFKSHSASRKHTVNDLIERFAEHCIPKHSKYYVKKVQLLQRWKEELGNLYLSDLSRAHISQVRDKMLNETTSKKILRSPSTVNRYMAAFSKVLSVAVNEWEWITVNPMFKISKPKEGRGRDRYLSLEEKNRLLEACKASTNPYLYSIVSLALFTGMRYGEIVKLKWNDINFDGRFMTLHETKNGERRVIPLTEEVTKILKDLYTNFGTNKAIFSNLKFTPTKNPISIRKSFARVLKVAGIENFRFHDLRHTAASYMAMGGATQGELMAILGHKSPKMTQRYAHYSQKHLSGVMERAYNTQNNIEAKK